MTRSPLALAALASAAVPGLQPVAVQEIRRRQGDPFQMAFVRDEQDRTWVVRAPLTPAAGAQLDQVEGVLRLLSGRLPFGVPRAAGHADLRQDGRAVVYPYLEGAALNWADLPPGPGIAAQVGRAIAALHNVPRELFEDAAMPSYEAEDYRTRKLADLDRAAETGHVPTRLLVRWERALEEVSLWRFAPTPTHGQLTGRHVLATFTDPTDASTGTVSAMTGWEHAQVADPADDFASLVGRARAEAVDTVLEAYAHARDEEPDRYLAHRARLAGELRLLSALLAALNREDDLAVTDRSDQLRRLDVVTSRGGTSSLLSEPDPSDLPGPSMPGQAIDDDHHGAR